MPPKKPPVTKAPARAPVKSTPAKGTPAKVTPGKKVSGAPATGAKKPGAAPSKGNVPAKPKEKVWTKQDDSARTIQTKYRQFRAKKILEKKKKEKMDYEELMNKLEHEAFLKLVQMEQEQAEKDRKKEEEERRRRAEEIKRKKRMLEAAFDGDNEEILQILKEVKELDDKNNIGNDVIGKNLRDRHLLAMVECEDANENTPISEAANGGNADTIKLLLDRGANPNTQGQFKRTPLYRAAFAGHLEACQMLLQNGADPRIYASDGQNPEQVASLAAVIQLLKEWDISQTEVLLEKLETEKEKRLEEVKQRRAAEESILEKQVEITQQEYDVMQKQLNHAYCELEKRISEHDNAVAEGFNRPEILVQAIQDAETEVEILKMNTEKSRDKLSQAKLKLREQQKGGDDGEDPDDLPGLKVLVKELDDVLFRDVGNKIKDSGKWPLIIDRTGQAATFLRYRDTNCVNALSPKQMEDDKVRLSLLGAVRFGKPFILDMMEVDMFDTVSDRFDNILKGLMGMIMDKSIMQEENYLKIVKESDGPDYQKNKFNDYRTSSFKFFIITKNPYPPDNLMDNTYPIRIYVPTAR
ncbi:Putative IQ motif and ankyrin repeat domain-containing protein LOC642574 homolog [Mytilus coruscus]|uniref:IQ motif and ankyrin repeat domain-containing protein LOC642574 homolog n=1 Tax=Mytilus coruscus TaxID=42192 RepID=A0A6J8AG17_MYTCO|nr:Putative IQ motif and ankyrin repeat domain-containing protein LOC642574 homolog [Mytilus coruscus]